MILRPHHEGMMNRLGKKVAPFLTRLLINYRLTGFLSLLESYVCFIQGKGAGTGWDLQGEVNAAVAHIHRDNAVIFDVGANVGEWTTHLVKALGPTKFRLFLFEPSETCRIILNSRKLPQATIIQAAVGDKPGIATFYSSGPASPIASLHARRDSYFQEHMFIEEAVNVIRIDDVMEEYHIDVVDFMKLDIEGNELAALYGAREALRAGRIRALTFEFGSPNINSRTYFRDFWEVLHPVGFSIHRICSGGFLIPIQEYYEDLEYFRGVTNYLASLEMVQFEHTPHVRGQLSEIGTR